MRALSRTLCLVLALARVSRAAPLVEPSVVRSSDGALTETLTVAEYEYATTTPTTVSFKTRGYFGSAETVPTTSTSTLKLGPTLRIKAGDRVRVNLVNALSANADAVVMNTYHTPGTTNLHTHGLHISSYDPLDNVLIKVEPGNSHQYVYDIASDHAAGTSWYHAHAHGSTAIQVGGGMAGVIIVEDASDEIPLDVAAVTEKIIVVQYIQFADVVTIASTVGMGETWTSTSTGTAGLSRFLVNGQYAPTITLNQNEWTRLRTVFMSLDRAVKLSLGAAASSLGCEWKLLAKDGIYVDDAPRAMTNVYMGPGNRADILIRCSSAGTFTVDSVGGTNPNAPSTTGVLNFDVVSSTSTATALTKFTAKKPVYLADIFAYTGTVETHSLTLAGAGGGPGGGQGGGQGGGPAGRRRLLQGGGGACLLNYDNAGPVSYTGNSLGDIAAGSVHTWTLGGANAHPLHIHINPFQLGTVVDATGDADSYFKQGDWHDVLFIPTGFTISQIHHHFADFEGKVVLHCHFLNHEDLGCMGYWTITGSNGTRATGLSASALATSTTPLTTTPPATPSAAKASNAVAAVFKMYVLCQFFCFM